MIYGIYLSAQGAEAQARRLDVIANNLTNVGTNAFKRDLALFQAHRPYDPQQQSSPGQASLGLQSATGGISLADVATDFSQGSVVETGGTYDVALVGEGFFRVAIGSQEFLTRNGSLTVNQLGELVTSDGGYPVLATGGGRISIPEDTQDIDIAVDGTVYLIDPSGSRNSIGQLDLVRPESMKQLEKAGGSLYRAKGDTLPAGDAVSVRQGYLELSGTESTREMMHMIEASRAFETNINMMKYQDDALGRLLEGVMRR